MSIGVIYFYFSFFFLVFLGGGIFVFVYLFVYLTSHSTCFFSKSLGYLVSGS